MNLKIFFSFLPVVSRIRKTSMQGNDIASILVECIIFPTLINKRFDFSLGVVKFDRFSHFSRSIGILWRRYNPFGMMFRIIFPPVIRITKNMSFDICKEALRPIMVCCRDNYLTIKKHMCVWIFKLVGSTKKEHFSKQGFEYSKIEQNILQSHMKKWNNSNFFI